LLVSPSSIHAGDGELKVNFLKPNRRGEKGQAAVEFALTIVFLMLLIVGFVELIMMLHTYNVMADAAKEGVRFAIVHGAANTGGSGPSTGSATTPPCTTLNATTTNVTSVKDAVKAYAQLSLHDVSNLTVNVCYFDGTNKNANRVGVAVSYPYQPFFGLGWPTVTVKAAAQGRIVF
jgi:Flp pilus assembly protein TadG